MPIPALVMAAVKYGPAIYGALQAAFGHREHVDWNEIQGWLSHQVANGYLTPEDLAAGDRTQSRLNEAADATGQMQTQDALTRMRQRGIDSAPDSEATLARIAASTARGRMGAADTAASQNYDTFLGNKQFEQAKIMALAQGKMGGAQQDAYAHNAGMAGTLNSLLQYIPTIIPKTGGEPTGATPPAAPATPNGAAPSQGFEPLPSGTNFNSGDPLPYSSNPLPRASAASRIAGAGKRRFNPATGMMEDAPDPSLVGAGSGGGGSDWMHF